MPLPAPEHVDVESGSNIANPVCRPPDTVELPLNETKPRGMPGGGNETILVAEDESAVRILVEKILRRAGYTVIGASDGEEALEIFRERATDISLVVLDGVMPRMSGLEAYRRMAEVQPDLPVLICSGYSGELASGGGELPAAGRLLQKPYALEELLGAVRERLGSRNHGS